MMTGQLEALEEEVASMELNVLVEIIEVEEV